MGELDADQDPRCTVGPFPGSKVRIPAEEWRCPYWRLTPPCISCAPSVARENLSPHLLPALPREEGIVPASRVTSCANEIILASDRACLAQGLEMLRKCQ